MSDTSATGGERQDGAAAVSEDIIEEATVLDPATAPEQVPDGDNLPDDPAAAVEALSRALEESRAKADRYLDDYRRMAAEFDNFRKRAQRDQGEMVARAAERVVVNLLPVLDSLDAAMALDAEADASEKLLEGMRGTREQLLATLRTEGLEPIETIGTEFDPEMHEAVQMDAGSGTMVVTAELRRGYRFKDRVLRAALVAVGYEEAGTS